MIEQAADEYGLQSTFGGVAEDEYGLQNLQAPKYDFEALMPNGQTDEGFFAKARDFVLTPIVAREEATKALVRGTEGLVASMSGVIAIMGDTNILTPEEKTRGLARGMSPESIAKFDAWAVKLKEIGETSKDFWSDAQTEGWAVSDRPEIWQGGLFENMSYVRLVSEVAGAIPSIGAGMLAATAATMVGAPAGVSTLAGATLLGLTQADDVYWNIKENMLKKGDSLETARKKALALYGVTAVVLTALEKLQLDRFMGGGKGFVLKDMLEGFATESVEELLQGLTMNAVNKYWGGQESLSMMEGIAESMLIGGITGGLFGGATSNKVNRVDALIKKGLDNKDFTQKELDDSLVIMADVLKRNGGKIDKMTVDRVNALKGMIAKVRVENQKAEVVENVAALPTVKVKKQPLEVPDGQHPGNSQSVVEYLSHYLPHETITALSPQERMRLYNSSTALRDFSQDPESFPEAQQKVKTAVEQIDAAVAEGRTDEGTADLAKYLVSEVNPDFDSDATIEFINEVNEATDQQLRLEGIKREEGASYRILGERVLRRDADRVKTALKLYKGSDPDTLVHEWYHDAYDRMTTADKDAFTEYWMGLDKNTRGTSVQEHFADEGRDYFFKTGLNEPAGKIEKIFAKFKESLLALVGRIKAMDLNKIPKSIQRMYEEGGRAKPFKVVGFQVVESNTGKVLTSTFDTLKGAERKMAQLMDKSNRKNFKIKKVWGATFKSSPKKVSINSHYQISKRTDAEKAEAIDSGDVTERAIEAIYSDQFLHYQPEKTKAGKMLGVPDGITKNNLPKLRKFLRQLVQEGEPGRYWYENVAAQALRITNGDFAKAEKFVQLLAIYSANSNVFVNTMAAVRVYNVWQGKGFDAVRDEYKIHAATGVQDQKARDILLKGKSWDGRKTNSFYINIMHGIYMQATDEQRAKMGLDAEMEAKISSAVTVDIWQLRAFGYEVHSATDDKSKGKYSFVENETRRITAELNRDRAEGTQPYLPHQVQAMMWTAIKARYEIKSVKALTNAESIKKGHSQVVTKTDEKGKTKTTTERVKSDGLGAYHNREHFKIWRKHALAATDAQVKEQVEESKISFADVLDKFTFTITGEVVPSSKLKYPIVNQPKPLRDMFSAEVSQVTKGADGQDLIAEKIGIPITVIESGEGSFEGKVNKNILASVIPTKVAANLKTKDAGYRPQLARLYALVHQYIYMQDAVPFFRAEMNPDFSRDFIVGNETGKGNKIFSNQAAALKFMEEYEAKHKNDKDYKPKILTGGKLARGAILPMSERLSGEKLEELSADVKAYLKTEGGYTILEGGELALVSYRGNNNIPLVQDEIFFNGLGKLIEEKGDYYGIKAEGSEEFGADSEYGHDQNWEKDPSGKEILSAIGEANIPDLPSWVSDRQSAVKEVLSKYDTKEIPARSKELAEADNLIYPPIVPDFQPQEVTSNFQIRKVNRIDAKIEELNQGVEELMDEDREYKKISTLSLLKKKLVAIKQGIRIGQIQTKEDVKEQQKKVEAVLTESDLTKEDKSKFIKTIIRVQTPEQFDRELPKLITRINKLVIAHESRVLRAMIDKQLKTSKPVKSGKFRKGRYDYETNKHFTALRSFQTLKQDDAQALLDNMGEVTTEIEKMISRFLSLKANGAAASIEIHKRVLQDILTAKIAGQQAETEASFEKMLDRQIDIDRVLEAVDETKGDKNSILNKISGGFIRGFGNLDSHLNAIAGEDVRSDFSPELAENNRETAKHFKSQEILARSAEILGLKSWKEVQNKLIDMASDKFRLVDFQGEEHEISRMELIDIYNSIKNDDIKTRYGNSFGTETDPHGQIDGLLEHLTEPEKRLADYWQVVAQSYYPVLNERHIEQFGMDLGQVDNYWMATSEKMVNIYDDLKSKSETPTARKERARGRVIPRPGNAYYKLQGHIAQAEHEQHLSRQFAQLKRLFSDRQVTKRIKEKYGDKVYKSLMDRIEDVSLNQQLEHLDAITDMWGKALNNWVLAKVALSPSVFIKQLLSVGNYMEQMPVKDWAAGFIEGVSNPKETMDWMWKNVPYLEARFQRGNSEAVMRAVDEAGKMAKYKDDWAKAMSSLVRGGDIMAIVYGGYPLMKAELAKHGDMQRAVDVFVKATLGSQQSGLASSRSGLQNSKNSFTRLFMAFKNTPSQYLRKMGDAVISYANGDMSIEQLRKVLTIYAVIQPALYGAASTVISGLLYGGDDDDDIGGDILAAIFQNPFNAVPLLDDVMQTSIGLARGKGLYKVFSTPILDDIEDAFRISQKKNISFFDVIEVIGTFAELKTAAPIKLYARILENRLGGKKSSKLITA